MSSAFHTRFVGILALSLSALSGCDSDPEVVIPPGGSETSEIQTSALVPAGGALTELPNPRAIPYYDNAEAVVNGMRLYKAYNCAGCHFNGGGGMGPPLMDKVWIYGGRLDQIFNSIYQGRPNGMPVWGGKITEDQIWQIATYVRSMSLPGTLANDSGGTPSQHPEPVPMAADMHGGWNLPPEYVGPE